MILSQNNGKYLYIITSGGRKYEGAIVIGKGQRVFQRYIKKSRNRCSCDWERIWSAENSDKIENYYGFEEPSGKSLLKRDKTGRKPALKLLPIVVSIEKYENFIVKLWIKALKQNCSTATGKSRVKIDIKVWEFKGKGISFCTVCDGFYRNVAVIGNGKYAANELSELMNFTRIIYSQWSGFDN